MADIIVPAILLICAVLFVVGIALSSRFGKKKTDKPFMSQKQYLIYIGTILLAAFIGAAVKHYLESKFGVSEWVAGFISFSIWFGPCIIYPFSISHWPARPIKICIKIYLISICSVTLAAVISEVVGGYLVSKFGVGGWVKYLIFIFIGFGFAFIYGLFVKKNKKQVKRCKAEFPG